MEILLTPNEQDILYHLVKALQPQAILEIGSYQGGSLAIFRNAAPQARIVSIEPEPLFDPATWQVEVLQKYSNQALPELIGQTFDFVFVDGNHSVEGCTYDLKNLIPLLQPTSVVVVHDSNYPDVHKALEAVADHYGPAQLLTPYLPGEWGGLAQLNLKNTVIKWGQEFTYRPGTFDLLILNEMEDQYQFVDYTKVDSVLDIGAHIGFYTNMVYSKNPQLKITSIEMADDNFTLLQKNTPHIPNITLLHGAAYYGKAQAIRWTDGNTGSGRLVNEIPNAPVAPLSISTKFYTLEQLLKTPVDVIKLDCEGSEFNLLENVKPATMKKVKYIVGEYHSSAADAKTLVTDFCLKHNWQISYLSTTDALGFFYLQNHELL